MRSQNQDSKKAVPGKSPLLSVIVPVYNEAKTIRTLLEKVVAVEIPKQIIVIDDGSNDDSMKAIESLLELPENESNSIEVVRHERNLGKGAAVRKGLSLANGEITIIQDADLEYDPAEYLKLMEPIQKGQAKVVYGSRFLENVDARNLSRTQRIGNRFLTWLFNRVYGQQLTDMETCHKAIHQTIVQAISPRLKQNGFGIEPEISAKIARLGETIVERPVSYQGRTVVEGKKIRFADGIAAIWYIIRYRFGS